MSDWWYAVNDERLGPVRAKELKALLARGEVNNETMVWQQGMDVWVPLSDTQLVPPRLSQQERARRMLALPAANRWARFVARCFDLWLETVLFMGLIGFILGRYSATYLEWTTWPYFSHVFGIASVPISFLLDAIVYAIFGNTPGKALLGLKVTDSIGEPLTFIQYLRRNMAVWYSGLGLGLPIVTLITMANQGGALKEGHQASYDETTGYRVRTKKWNVFRFISFGIAFCGLISLISVLSIAGNKIEKRNIEIASQKFYIWNNPLTHLDVSVNARWRFSPQKNEDGKPVYIFTEQNGRAAVVFAVEEAPRLNIGDYVPLFQASTASQMKFEDAGTYYEMHGRTAWRGKGVLPQTRGSRFHVSVIQLGDAFWRVVSIQTPPYDYSDDKIKVLEQSLWESVLKDSVSIDRKIHKAT
jgi:uncharacterized RDD family membrane protein YckC